MVRHYKRKTPPVDAAALQQAKVAVQQGGLSIQAACKRFKVPKSTLQRHTKNNIIGSKNSMQVAFAAYSYFRLQCIRINIYRCSRFRYSRRSKRRHLRNICCALQQCILDSALFKHGCLHSILLANWTLIYHRHGIHANSLVKTGCKDSCAVTRNCRYESLHQPVLHAQQVSIRIMSNYFSII